jgi:hypothetical protein
MDNVRTAPQSAIAILPSIFDLARLHRQAWCRAGILDKQAIHAKAESAEHRAARVAYRQVTDEANALSDLILSLLPTTVEDCVALAVHARGYCETNEDGSDVDTWAEMRRICSRLAFALHEAAGVSLADLGCSLSTDLIVRDACGEKVTQPDAALHLACAAYWVARKAERDGCGKDEDLPPAIIDAVYAAMANIEVLPATTIEGMRAKAKVAYHVMTMHAGKRWQTEAGGDITCAITALADLAGESLT